MDSRETAVSTKLQSLFKTRALTACNWHPRPDRQSSVERPHAHPFLGSKRLLPNSQLVNKTSMQPNLEASPQESKGDSYAGWSLEEYFQSMEQRIPQKPNARCGKPGARTSHPGARTHLLSGVEANAGKGVSAQVVFEREQRDRGRAGIRSQAQARGARPESRFNLESRSRPLELGGTDSRTQLIPILNWDGHPNQPRSIPKASGHLGFDGNGKGDLHPYFGYGLHNSAHTKSLRRKQGLVRQHFVAQ